MGRPFEFDNERAIKNIPYMIFILQKFLTCWFYEKFEQTDDLEEDYLQFYSLIWLNKKILILYQ